MFNSSDGCMFIKLTENEWLQRLTIGSTAGSNCCINCQTVLKALTVNSDIIMLAST